MTARRRFSQTESLQQRLAAFAKDARKKAATLPPGRERGAVSGSVSRTSVRPPTTTVELALTVRVVAANEVMV